MTLTTDSSRRLLGSCLMLLPLLIVPQGGRDVGCSEWHDCRQQALAAAEQSDYERFHDLAWRTVQLGPKNDPALLAMLARAQSLSGRPHDALVMLDRLAGMNVVVDADTNDDFARARNLPGWPEVLAHIERVRTSGSARTVDAAPAAASPSAAKPAPAPPAAETPRPAAETPRSAAETPRAAAPTEAVRVPPGSFTPGGMAFDAVSDRFLFGDRLGRKLIVVGAQSNRATDFVRADSAGFQEIAAVEIDQKRGDLWVASTAPGTPSSIVHKLQLISGRPLRSFPVAADLEPAVLVDLAVTAAGAVLALDSAGGQLLMLRPGAAALERVIRLDARQPASLAAGADEGIAYVAHGEGVLRVDLRARTASPLTAPASVPLDRLERIRLHDHSLVAVRLAEDGSRRIVRLDLNGSGRAVRQATTLEEAVPTTTPTFMTFSGDELVYLANGANGADGSAPDAAHVAGFVAYRLRLR